MTRMVLGWGSVSIVKWFDRVVGNIRTQVNKTHNIMMVPDKDI